MAIMSKIGGVAIGTVAKVGGVDKQSISSISGASIAASDFHTQCITLNGLDEHLANETNNTIGIENAWTINLWINLDAVDSSANERVFYLINSGNNNDAILFMIEASSGKLWVWVYDSGGTKFKDFLSKASIGTSKTMLTVTFDGGVDGDPLLIYRNATDDTTGSPVTDNAGTMSTGTRRMWLASNVGINSFMGGTFCKASIFSAALDQANITELYNAGDGYKRDDRDAVGNYDQQGTLVHQEALGKDATLSTQSDYVSEGRINVYTDDDGIEAGNIATFS